MKILYITSHLDDFGSYMVLKGMFAALKRAGDEVTYVNLKQERDLKKRNGTRSDPTSPVRTRSASVATRRRKPSAFSRLTKFLHSVSPASKRIIYDNLRSLPKHLQVIDEVKPDIIIGRNASSALTCLIARFKCIPYLTHMDGIQEVESRYGVKATLDYRFFARFGRQLFARFGNDVAVVTDAVKEVLVAHGLEADKITVLNNGVDTDVFRPEVERDPLAEKLEGKTVVGFVGSFQPWHRIDDFMKLVPEVIQEDPSIAFVFLGKPPDAVDGTTPERSENIIILDSVAQDRVPSIVACFDIGILPFTAYSCSPLKIYEYMAMGKATIAPRWPSVEIIIDHEKDGYLFEPDAMDALKAGIHRLAKDRGLRERLGTAARKKMVERFTWDQCSRRFRGALEATVAAYARD